MPTHTTCTDPRQPWRDRDAVIEPCVRAAAAPRATSCPRRCPPPMPFAPMSLGPTRQANRNQPFRGQSFDIQTRSSKITGPTNESCSAILTMPLRTLSSPRRALIVLSSSPSSSPSSCLRRALVVFSSSRLPATLTTVVARRSGLSWQRNGVAVTTTWQGNTRLDSTGEFPLRRCDAAVLPGRYAE